MFAKNFYYWGDFYEREKMFSSFLKKKVYQNKLLFLRFYCCGEMSELEEVGGRVDL
jgi:hypothetical protein